MPEPDFFNPERIGQGIRQGLASPKRRPEAHVEVAFFGGTFTGLDRARQADLLAAVVPFWGASLEKPVRGVRLSTRPDAITQDGLVFLKERGVTTVELGVQSMDDQVLEAAERGHTADQTRRAAALIKSAGLRLGIQLLPGLPKEDDASRVRTQTEVLKLAPEDVRLYPLLVIRGTALAKRYHQGQYQPLSLERAVAICSAMYVQFTKAGIQVIRIGLQNNRDLDRNFLAGPYHPALGHLVKSEVYARAVIHTVSKNAARSNCPSLNVAPQDISQALGHRRSNMKRLLESGFFTGLDIRPNPDLTPGRFRWLEKEYSVISEAMGYMRDHVSPSVTV